MVVGIQIAMFLTAVATRCVVGLDLNWLKLAMNLGKNGLDDCCAICGISAVMGNVGNAIINSIENTNIHTTDKRGNPISVMGMDCTCSTITSSGTKRKS